MIQNDYQIDLSSSPSLQKLSQMKGMYIKKSLIVTECCLVQNQYGIYSKEQDGQIDEEPIFQCAEVSSRFQRYCLYGDCRSFKIMVSQCNQRIRDQFFNDNIFLEFEKPFTCSLFCLFSPKMKIYLTCQGQKLYIGRIVVPFYCLSRQMVVDVYDQNDNKKFQIKDSCLKCTLIFGGCCCSESCKKEYINVNDENQQRLSPITIKAKNCCHSFVLPLTDKEFMFPELSNASDKVLWLAAIIMFDMTFYEFDPKRRRNVMNLN